LCHSYSISSAQSVADPQEPVCSLVLRWLDQDLRLIAHWKLSKNDTNLLETYEKDDYTKGKIIKRIQKFSGDTDTEWEKLMSWMIKARDVFPLSCKGFEHQYGTLWKMILLEKSEDGHVIGFLASVKNASRQNVLK
jgi:hypothetical protein